MQFMNQYLNKRLVRLTHPWLFWLFNEKEDSLSNRPNFSWQYCNTILLYYNRHIVRESSKTYVHKILFNGLHQGIRTVRNTLQKSYNTKQNKLYQTSVFSGDNDLIRSSDHITMPGGEEEALPENTKTQSSLWKEIPSAPPWDDSWPQYY